MTATCWNAIVSVTARRTFTCAVAAASLVAAVMAEDDRTYAVIAVTALDDREAFNRPPSPMDFGPEDEAARLARRRARWTPTTVAIAD